MAPQIVKEQKSISITIPAGMKPGNQMTINLPNGKTVQVTIPKGMVPGNNITVNCKCALLPSKLKTPLNLQCSSCSLSLFL